MKLRQALLGCSTGQLGRIAAAWDIQPEAGALRRELVETLADVLTTRAQDDEVWAGLGARETAALHLIARAGGRHALELLARRLARQAGDGEDAEEARLVDAALTGLVERGLLYRVFEADRQRRGVVLLLPDELLAAARRYLEADGPVARLAVLERPDDVARCQPGRDLFVLASALRREVWNEASRGLAGKPARTVGQLLGALQAAEPGGPGDLGRRWRFLVWIAQRAGWIGDTAWPLPDDDRLERLLAEPGTISGLALAAAGLGTDSPVGSSSSATSDRGAEVARLHADALQLLSELTPGDWHAADDVLGWLASELGIDRSERPHGGRRSAERTTATLGRWLAGRWLWLGLVAWGRRGAGWDRVTTLSQLRAVVQNRPSDAASDAWAACVPGADLQLRAPRGAELAVLYRCERYLAYAGGGTGDRDYRLTPTSFDRGRRLGGSVEELTSLLGRLFQSDLPAGWREAIEDWAGERGRLRVAARLVVTTDSAAELDALLAEPAAGAAIEERLSDRHAVVRADRLAELLTELAQAGRPVDVDAALRAEATSAARASALAGGVAEAAWVALETLRRLAPDAVASQRDLQAARRSLDATLPAAVVEVLERRAVTIAAAIADTRAERRRPRGRRRAV